MRVVKFVYSEGEGGEIIIDQTDHKTITHRLDMIGSAMILAEIIKQAPEPFKQGEKIA